MKTAMKFGWNRWLGLRRLLTRISCNCSHCLYSRAPSIFSLVVL